MGLDIAFNRAQALKAGLVLTEPKPRGTEEEIQDAEMRDDASYIQYLRTEEVLVQVPGTTGHYVSDDGPETTIIVRANKWGSTYEPLTKWLIEKNIKWSEF